MKRLRNKILSWLVLLLRSIMREPMLLDQVNKKLVRPVEGLVIEGVQYYQFVEPADMPEARQVHYLNFKQEMGMGLDRELLLSFVERLKEANNAHDATRLGSYLIALEDCLQNLTPLESLYNMASLVWFDAQEDISNYDVDYNRDKISRFKKIKDRAFFFSCLLQSGVGLNTAEPQSLNDISNYLTRTQLRLKAYKQMLSVRGA